jgi:hypothetical protein
VISVGPAPPSSAHGAFSGAASAPSASRPCPSGGPSCFEHLGWLLSMGSVELLVIARNALFDLLHPPIHLGAGEVLVSIVHCFEFTAVDCNAGLRQQTDAAAEHNKSGADLADDAAIVLTKVSNRLVVRNKAACEPHRLNVASSLPLKPPTRLNPRSSRQSSPQCDVIQLCLISQLRA